MIAPNQREASTEAASTMAGVFLAIEGPIGVGKTTLALLLHQIWQSELVLEHFDEKAFLPLFSTDRQRYAWQTQLHFLIDRFDQWTELHSAPILRVSDYLFDLLSASLLSVLCKAISARTVGQECCHSPAETSLVPRLRSLYRLELSHGLLRTR